MTNLIFREITYPRLSPYGEGIAIRSYVVGEGDVVITAQNGSGMSVAINQDEETAVRMAYAILNHYGRL